MKIDVTQDLIDYDGGSLPDTVEVGLNASVVAHLPVAGDGKPIYLDDDRKPRPMTLRRLVWKALNEGLPNEGEGAMSDAEKEKAYPITALVMVGAGTEVELDDPQVEFVLTWIKKRRSSWEWGQANALVADAKKAEIIAQARIDENLRTAVPGPEPEPEPEA